MEKPDFSKIWGENGNVTYKFSDDNYLKGWGFVGNIPPARGMFDAYFQGTDKKLKWLDNALGDYVNRDYTIDDTKNPTDNKDTLPNLLSGMANMIKTTNGTDDWKKPSATSLKDLSDQIASNNLYHAESTGYGIVSGCEPSINGLTVTVSAGVVHLPDGSRRKLEAQSITLKVADKYKVRADVVYIDNNGVVKVITGENVEKEVTPIVPDLPESNAVSAVIATCYISEYDQTIIDCRSMIEIIKNNKSLYGKSQKVKYSIGLSSHDMRLNRINDFPKKGYYVIRDDIDWNYVETSKGSYNFDKYISQLQAYRNAGVKGDCIFTFGNALYKLDGESNSCTYNSERAAAYKNFVLAFVEYMKSAGIEGLIIEIINEPNNLAFFYSNGNRLKDYFSIVKSLYNDIKLIDETATVVACNFAVGKGFSSVSLSDIDTLLSYGIADYCDAIGIHPYTTDKPERMSEYYENLIYKMGKVYSLDIPIVCNEVGYSVCDEDKYTSGYKILADESNRKNYIPRIILNNLRYGIKLTCIYCYRKTGENSSGNSEQLFGIYNTDGTRTSTAIAIENLSNQIGDMVYAGVYTCGKNYQVAQFVDKNGFISYVMWAYKGTDTVNVNGRQYIIDESPKFIRGYGCEIKENTDYLQRLYGFRTNNIILSHNTVLDSDSSYDDGNIAINDSNVICGTNNTTSIYNIVVGDSNFADGLALSKGKNNYGGPHSIVSGHSNITYGASESKVQRINSINGTKIYVSSPKAYTVGETCLLQVPWGKFVSGKVLTIGSDYIDLETTSEIPQNSTYIVGTYTHNVHQIAIGTNCITTGYGAASGGEFCVTSNDDAFTYGYQLVNTKNRTAMFGAFNNVNATGLFVLGNGTETARSNAFRITQNGSVYGQGAYNSSGADYAECFEWADENIEGEDRIGYFVTFDTGEKIRKAKGNDTYILGIVSGNASVIGNSYNDQWQNMYVTDDFGRIQYEDVEVANFTDDDGNIIIPAHTEKRMKINPDYDNTQEYIGRENRKEWSAVGMLGVLPVRDDGTCEVNGYCKVADGGIATKANSGYRVVARVADNIIKVLFR